MSDEIFVSCQDLHVEISVLSVDIVQLIDDRTEVLVFLRVSSIQCQGRSELTSSMTCPIRDLYGSHSSRKFMWPEESTKAKLMIYLNVPMCPVEVKPDGTSSSGGRTEVKISSRFSATDTALKDSWWTHA